MGRARAGLDLRGASAVAYDRGRVVAAEGARVSPGHERPARDLNPASGAARHVVAQAPPPAWRPGGGPRLGMVEF
jgi:hypothetical protein